VYVTHDQIEAIALCDRLAIMREGHIEQVGTYDRLVERPDNAFVAEFVGLPPMNLFHGHWTEDGWQGPDFAWPLPPNRRHQEGHAGILGVRAGNITVGHRLPPNSQGELPHARVTLVEPMLSEHVLLLYMNAGHVDFAVRVPTPFDVKVDDNLAFGFDTNYLTLFDGVNGRRLD
jgi:multiple sugar transport system ATP-binding protein